MYALGLVHQREPDERLKAALYSALDYMSEKLSLNSQGMVSYMPADGTSSIGHGQLLDNSWAALAFITGYELGKNRKYLERFEGIYRYLKSALSIKAVQAYRTWSVPEAKNLRDSEKISEAVPLEGNAVLALALAKAARITGDRTLEKEARVLAGVLSRVDPVLLDENQDDSVKLYLQGLTPQMRALDLILKNK